ncbi:hypothetical protein H6G89_29105 [Oscillatoria sp. FACHB-1407]|uniref:hypothetical protein n=1 Tax=Oscillatoria sp. FACHB-1407 TaxID=2692847 RepID=UPI001689E259|nr:hypothetical protein [Oscillatoria sp. FACHB-1407]MBD2465070.1 hypothetical protein [Oscillatoria sp. FACHB-1407]
MSNPSVHTNLLWDIAGIDGLQVMKTLFGDGCDRIAPFQSFETELDHTPCSILRLCESNFRIRWLGEPNDLESMLHSVTKDQRVWVKQFPWLVSVQLPHDLDIVQLSQIAIAKPPFSLPSLASNCAAPARIETLSVLVWRHTLQTSETLELHTAKHSLETLEQSLSMQRSSLLEAIAL